MVAGDLSTQRFNRDEYLSLITTGSPARDDDSGRQHTVIRRGPNWPKRCPAPVISTAAKRSGEISLQSVTSSMVAGDLSTQRFNRDEYLSLITTGSPARDDDSGRQHTVIRRGPNWPKRCPAPVISTAAKRSGEISLQSVTSSMVAGDLSTLRFIRALSPCHPYRRVSPSRGRKVQRDHLLFPLEGGKETGFIGEQSEPRIQ